jgi:transposase InsO family protein
VRSAKDEVGVGTVCKPATSFTEQTGNIAYSSAIMPWQEYQALEQRMMFIAEYESEGGSFTALCARYAVSRMTGYKWLDRFEAEGLPGLWERSRAPHRVRHALSEKLVRLILEAQEAHPSWGPRKLLARLKVTHSRVKWCVISTVGELLRRKGLVEPRIYRRRSAPRREALEPYAQANGVWCTDFKGWFVLGNGQRCEPWTLTDGWSRYLLRVEAMKHQELEGVRQGFEGAFREHGLPEVIRSDNGRPFAGLGFGGLSQLSVWWIKLGIRPERIRPGKPQENGRHERMHLTLLEACEPPENTFRGQQRRFDAFRQEFNEERPHEALGDQPPAQVYQPSSRCYPKRIPRVEYETGVLTKRVHQHGDITWQGERLFLNETLAGEEVALEPLTEGFGQVRFGPMRLAKLDERKRRIIELTAEDLAP